MARAWLDTTFPATPHQVRAVLADLRRGPLARLPRDRAEDIELVLAEAMNNIVEHAYAGQSGPLRLSLRRFGDRLSFRLLDIGRAMPGIVAPAGDFPLAPSDSLAEGGYGWFLMRRLARRLYYRRWKGVNLLVVDV